ncbi:hypothetical protein JOF29_003297 [Kribbella aluminosa]|uniref:Uncharacterized protein n=1 Tax=Kribbella aluminosa TaxID=416017 RepID=A0ABS4UKS8_9ACTN|nr:hypothetical protein [Kribbella aluminosa]
MVVGLADVPPVVVDDDSGAGRPGPGSVVTQGGARSVRVGDGVLSGCNGLPTGSDGRVVDLDVPAVRSTLGVDRADGVCAGSCDPSGPRYRKPASSTTPAAPAPNFSTGGRRRTCRGLDCLTTEPFTPGRPAAYRSERLNRSSLSVPERFRPAPSAAPSTRLPLPDQRKRAT